VKRNRGTASRLAANFNITPANATAPSSSESLHGRFLGGESRRITLHAIGFGITVASFSFGEDSVEKAGAETFYGFRDSVHFRDVDAGADDHAELS
jgi:hypothetical protein